MPLGDTSTPASAAKPEMLSGQMNGPTGMPKRHWSAQEWFSELKRRRVFRTLVAYGIAAFAILQVIEPIMHGAHWPDVVLSYVVAGLAAGFPIVITLAWIFDVRQGRIERTAPAVGGSAPSGVPVAVLLVVIGVLAAAPGLLYYFVLRGGARGPSTETAADRKSIAVLPFVNMSSDKENEYFSDGMTEELINALAHIDGLRVASRTSAFAFKGKDIDVRQIGEKLNVGAVLEGSIRRDADRLRISAQLINVADGYHIWSNVYEREVKNIFALEDELVRSIVQALKPKLTQNAATPLVKPATASLAAHDLYLKGRYFWNKRNPEAVAKAAEYFQQAIEQDPSYALAYVGLADCTALVEYGSVSAAEALPKARQAALKALELDETLAEAHEVLGLIGQHSYDWGSAEREYQRAIELQPEYSSVHHRYGLLLMTMGRVKEARLEAERARQLDPTSLIVNNMLTFMLVGTREYDRAIEQAKKTLELDPGFEPVRLWLARAYMGLGRYPEALAELENLKTSAGAGASRDALLGYAYAMSGRRADALRMLAELDERSKREYVPASTRALIYIGLGDKDQAFVWLDRAYDERDWRLRELKTQPMFDSLRSDERFTRLLKRMRLE